MNVLLIGDFHGELPSIRQLDKDSIDYVIALGDYCSIDVIKKKLFQIIIKGKEPKINDLNDDINAIKDQLLQEFRIIIKFLNEIGRTYFVFGNTDLLCFFDEMINISNEYNALYLGKGRKEKIGDFNLIGLDGMPKRGPINSWINDTPEIVNTFNDKTVYKNLEKIFKKIYGPTIFVSHAPSYKMLDMPSQDNNPDIFLKLYGELNIGSKSVRKIINTFHPSFHLSAHTHNGGDCLLTKNGYKTRLINVGAALNNDYSILTLGD